MGRAGPTDRCTLLATIRMKTQSEREYRTCTYLTTPHSGGTRNASSSRCSKRRGARGGFSWTALYVTRANGIWFDTSVNWPLNDRGDITGS